MSSPGTATAPVDPAYAAETNMPWIIGVLSAFHFVALIMVAMRVYTRTVMLRAPGLDDLFIVLGSLCAFGGGWLVLILEIPYGLGTHQSTISASNMVFLQHTGFWQSIVSTAGAIMFIKVSIAFNLLRLSSNRWYSWSLWGIIVFVVLYEIAGIILFLVRCKPMAGFWDPSLHATCYSIALFVDFGVMNTSFNIFTDVFLATIPVPIVWGLQMKRKLRLYVIGILSLGYFAVAIGVVKAVYQINFGSNHDTTFEMSVQFWGFLQINLGLMAACAPALKPLVGRMLGLSSHDNYYRYGSNGYGTGRSRTGTTPRMATLRGGSEGGTKSDIELQERSLDDGDSSGGLSGGKAGNISIATSTFYRHASEEGSEEKILRQQHEAAAASAAAAAGRPPGAGGPQFDFRGIMRTTEVIVK